MCIYIYIYIYGPGLVSISDMKFSKAWGLYFIWSLRTLTCVSAAMLLDSIEPSWQPETHIKFSSKTLKGPGLVSISDMKFSKAWGLYFIWSLRTLTCVSAAMLLDSIELSWQPETHIKFSSKTLKSITISHLRDFMGSGPRLNIRKDVFS